MIFATDNWLWKSEIRDLHGQISNRRWSTKDLLQWESAIYHSIKLGFEGQVAKKILNGIYWLCQYYKLLFNDYCELLKTEDVIFSLIRMLQNR